MYRSVNAAYRESNVILNAEGFKKFAPEISNRTAVIDLKVRNQGFLLIMLTGFWNVMLSIKKPLFRKFHNLRKSGIPLLPLN